MIHKSHSRKELIEIIEVFELWDIDDYGTITKEALAICIWSYLKDMKSCKEDKDVFFIQDIIELREYLMKPTPRQVISSEVKLVLLDKIRNIMFYAKHTGYFLSGSNYDTLDEVVADAKYISRYGDNSSVRRALRFYNADMSNPVKIQPIITKRTQKRLKKIDDIKANTLPSFKSKKGEFLVEFL